MATDRIPLEQIVARIDAWASVPGAGGASEALLEVGRIARKSLAASETEDTAEVKAILQKACDRDWEDETLLQTAHIAANAIYWRDVEINKLKNAAPPLSGAVKAGADRGLETPTAVAAPLKYRMTLKFDGGVERVVEGEYPAPPSATQDTSEDTALLEWAETHPEEFMRENGTWWALAGRGCRETRFYIRNVIRSAMRKANGQSPV